MTLSGSELAQLSRIVANQARDLKCNGGQAKLADSGRVLERAKTAWREHRTQPNQGLWRRAALAHAAVLGFAGRWQDMLYACDGNPDWAPIGSDRFPTPDTPDNRVLAALMSLDSAVGCIRRGQTQDRGLADSFARQALSFLNFAPNAPFNPWKAVAYTILAIGYSINTADKRRRSESADRALRLSTPSQVELRIIALKLAGKGDGFVRPSNMLSRKRLAELQASECLYLFNE